MAVTVASLIARYPEYELAESALIQAHIDAAVDILDETVTGELYDEIVLETACNSLALTSFSEPTAIDRAAGITTKHMDRLRRLKLAAGPGSTGIVWGS